MLAALYSTADIKGPLQAKKAHWNLSEWALLHIGKKSEHVPEKVRGDSDLWIGNYEEMGF